MRKSPPPQDFEIHVDPSCLSDNAEEDAIMSTDRTSNESSETVVHHESWTEDDVKNEIPATNDENPEEDIHEDIHGEKENSPPPTHTEDKEDTTPTLDGSVHENSEQKEVEHTEEVDVTEEDDKENEARDRRIERIEAEIQAAARAVVANIHNEDYDEHEDSVLSAQTDGSYDFTDTGLAHEAMDSAHDEKEDSFISDHDAPSERSSDQEGGDSSSHHDGDVDDDDVFSTSDQSKRSSMNSTHSSNDHQKLLTSPTVGEEAASASEGQPISRIPSATSYIHTPTIDADRTPSRVLSRPPFRTPSSVRAMQMSSPTASVFSSPRSTKRHLPTGSRIGTPNSQYSPSKRTPTRLKPRKAAPLVLLHVTVMPLQWPYSHLMALAEIPESLQHVKQSWKLLQDKIGDTVLERGVLLSHPQESYEVLEERLYEALELPVRPIAKILKCGHYMGPLEPETPSSDEENDYFEGLDVRDGRTWCDICGRDVRVEEVGDLPKGEKRFTVKIYASNGLMRSGAWEAAWREMERVDVELEPFVDTNLRAELEHLAAITPREELVEQHDDGFEDVEPVEHVHEKSNEFERQAEDARAREKEELIARTAREDEMRQRIMEEEDLRKRMMEDDEMKNLIAEEEALKRKMAEEDNRRQHMKEQEAARLNEEKMRQIYGQEAERSQSRRTSLKSSVHDDSSFVELLVAAFKVVLRDSRNLAIGILSILVLLLALSSKTGTHTPMPMIMENASAPQIITTVFKNAPVASLENTQSSLQQFFQSMSTSTETKSVVQITTTVIREYTVTERAPVPTSAESLEVSTASVSQVTTTIFREKTITEHIPAPTAASGIDPCESVISSQRELPVAESEVVNAGVQNKKISGDSATDDFAVAESEAVEAEITTDQVHKSPSPAVEAKENNIVFKNYVDIPVNAAPESLAEDLSINKEAIQELPHLNSESEVGNDEVTFLDAASDPNLEHNEL